MANFFIQNFVKFDDDHYKVLSVIMAITVPLQFGTARITL